MEKKTHYRKVFKSDHLGVADLEEMNEKGTRLVFTVKEVKQHLIVSGVKNSGVVVAGKRISANIAHFNEDIKPFVLNATNSGIMKSFANNSPLIEDWANKAIELYIDPTVSMKGEVVGGVRIRPVQPKMSKPVLTAKHPRFEDAKKASIDGKLQAVLDRYEVSNEVLALLQ